MAHDSTDNPDEARLRKSRRGATADVPPQETAPPDLDPAAAGSDDEDDARLPDIPGVCGIVPESIVPGHYGIEAGQSAVGDIFNWYVSRVLGKHRGECRHCALGRRCWVA